MLLAASVACAQTDVVSRVDAIVAELTDAKSPGLAVLVRRDGQTVCAQGYGVRDLRTRDRIDASTNFRLASFTKQFTAMAIMLLVHDGKLRYSDSLTTFFPRFSAYGRSITIRHLLTHTSGLPDYEDLMERAEREGQAAWTLTHQIQDEEVLALLQKETSPKFAAGSSWAYSNSGYVALGLIVAKVSGEPFGDYLARRIFRPLKMNTTVVFVSGKNSVERRAFGHTVKDGVLVEADQSSTSATGGDGGIYSNLLDLAKWDAALENRTLLSEPEMRAALTPVKLADGSATTLDPAKPVMYGFGWFLDPWQGRQRMWHSGTTTGFRTVIDRFLEPRVTVVVLSNRTDLETTDVALRVAAVVSH